MCVSTLDGIAHRLHTSLSRRRAWPARIALCLHTSLSRRRTWPARITPFAQSTSGVACATSDSRRWTWLARPWPRSSRPWPHRPWTAHKGRPTLGAECPRLPWTAHNGQPWPARIGRGLRNIGRGVVDNMRMSMHSQNQKSVKHPSCITIYSSIFHHPFSTFPPHVVRSP